MDPPIGVTTSEIGAVAVPEQDQVQTSLQDTLPPPQVTAFDVSGGTYQTACFGQQTQNVKLVKEDHIVTHNYAGASIGEIHVHNHQEGSATPSNSSGAQGSSEVRSEWIELKGKIRMFPSRILGDRHNIVHGEIHSAVTGVKPLAIKFLPFCEMHVREANLLKNLKHHHVVGVILCDSFPGQPFRQMYIAMERCDDKNLHQFILERKQNHPFNRQDYTAKGKQIVEGLCYIHSQNIIHRDLKPHNILLSLCGRYLKIADFGLSKAMTSGRSVTAASISRVGTDGYRAPETYGGDEISQLADIFSLGVTLFFIWSYGHHPYGNEPEAWNYFIKTGKAFDLRGRLVEDAESATALINQMLQYNPKERPTAEATLKHLFFTSSTKSSCACQISSREQRPSISRKHAASAPPIPLLSAEPRIPPNNTLTEFGERRTMRSQSTTCILADSQTTIPHKTLTEGTHSPASAPMDDEQKVMGDSSSMAYADVPRTDLTPSEPAESRNVHRIRTRPSGSGTCSQAGILPPPPPNPRRRRTRTIAVTPTSPPSTSYAELPSSRPSKKVEVSETPISTGNVQSRTAESLLTVHEDSSLAPSDWLPTQSGMPLSGDQHTESLCDATFVTPLEPRVMHDLPKITNGLLVFDNAAQSAAIFEPEKSLWKEFHKIPPEMQQQKFSAAIAENSLYIVGCNKSLFRLKLQQSNVQWRKLPSMKKEHGDRPPVAVADGKIYVLGSRGKSSIHSSKEVEKFIPSREEWVSETPMLQTRHQHAVVSTREGIIYCIGGESCSTLKSVDKFCSGSSLWSSVKSMNQSRSNPAAVELGKKIYVLGGFRSSLMTFESKLSSVEMYDISTDSWTTIAEMQRPRASFPACAVGMHIFAIGGHEKGFYEEKKTIEKYDVSSRKWNLINIPAWIKLDNTSAVALAIQ